MYTTTVKMVSHLLHKQIFFLYNIFLSPNENINMYLIFVQKNENKQQQNLALPSNDCT